MAFSRRDIMDAEVARWISEAPFPDDFDITFENLLAHGLISPEVLETLEVSNQIPSSAISGTVGTYDLHCFSKSTLVD